MDELVPESTICLSAANASSSLKEFLILRQNPLHKVSFSVDGTVHLTTMNNSRVLLKDSIKMTTDGEF